MRLNEDETAATVLQRLRANEPRPPVAPHVDETFDQRHRAWREAVAREEARARTEEQELQDRAAEQERRRLAGLAEKLAGPPEPIIGSTEEEPKVSPANATPANAIKLLKEEADGRAGARKDRVQRVRKSDHPRRPGRKKVR